MLPVPRSALKATCGFRGIKAFASRNLSLNPNHSIYISNSTNPYFNLSLEDWLFRHKSPKEPLLLLYRDEPCVVIGRNQNPWKEVNMRALRRTGVPFIRRRSGGGTVYHDLGNTNFSVHLPRTSFDRHATAQVVLSAVRSLGIDARVNDRNDICVGEAKISYHGFLPLRTRLGIGVQNRQQSRIPSWNYVNFNKVGLVGRFAPFKQGKYGHEGGGIRPVSCFAFRKEYNVHEQVHIVEEDQITTNIDYIRNGMAELPNWEWAFGQTPEFTHTIQHSFKWGDVMAKIHSKHGVILGCSLTASASVGAPRSSRLQELAARLENQKYGFVDESGLGVESWDEANYLHDVWQWMKAEMDS
ncbi:hypothetical protein AcW2_006260 [Taiwanofungus camphoratus]|nr:hypothetical protein AcW2_006260 [Antrodia cinnamomea]